jgi:hypothetical protein
VPDETYCDNEVGNLLHKDIFTAGSGQHSWSIWSSPRNSCQIGEMDCGDKPGGI